MRQSWHIPEQMSELFLQRCLNHAQREAAAKCPSCGHYFCRECISEHDGRVICANCARALVKPPFYKRKSIERVMQIAHCCLGFAAAWFLFYLLGEALLKLPSSFHDGTIWENQGLNKLNGLNRLNGGMHCRNVPLDGRFRAAGLFPMLWPGTATLRLGFGECPSRAQQCSHEPKFS